MDIFSIKNKVILVIGGLGKIGFDTSIALAKQGAQVIIGTRSIKTDDIKNELIKKYNIVICQFDASIESETITVLNLIIEKFNKLDVLINCASWRPMKKFMKDETINWEKSLAQNSLSVFVPSRVFGNYMSSKKMGSIINFSSIYGITAPRMDIYKNCNFETEPDYPFLKAGIIGFSKYLSSYFAASNVRVNVIAPGGVFNNQNEDFVKRYSKNTTLGRMASTDDLIGGVIFLSSDASKYITGIVLPIDGGWTSI